MAFELQAPKPQPLPSLLSVLSVLQGLYGLHPLVKTNFSGIFLSKHPRPQEKLEAAPRKLESTCCPVLGDKTIPEWIHDASCFPSVHKTPVLEGFRTLQLRFSCLVYLIHVTSWCMLSCCFTKWGPLAARSACNVSPKRRAVSAANRLCLVSSPITSYPVHTKHVSKNYTPLQDLSCWVNTLLMISFNHLHVCVGWKVLQWTKMQMLPLIMALDDQLIVSLHSMATQGQVEPREVMSSLLVSEPRFGTTISRSTQGTNPDRRGAAKSTLYHSNDQEKRSAKLWRHKSK